MTRRGLTRRELLTGLVAGAGGVAVGAVGASAAAAVGSAAEPAPISDAAAAAAYGTATEPFFGPHQAGVSTPAQAHAVFAAFDLRPGVDREALGRLMRLVSDDAARLTAGQAALADDERELAATPSRLTVTFGFGPGFLAAAGAAGAAPASLRPLPAFSIDRLQDGWSGGDLLVHVGSDDRIALAHAQRMLGKDIRAFATPRWVQVGFLHGHGVTPPGTTPRNLFGQVDGTVNPVAGSAELDRLVWAQQPDWFAGGTLMVIRRIRMDLDRWDILDRSAREQALGRRLSDGAPLTGSAEADVPDFAALDERGLTVIPPHAHIRRARGDATGPQLLRRGYNYEAGLLPSGSTDSGLIFVAYQADIDRQFLPMQRRLEQLDLLNLWTTPIGSAVFAVPPGAAEGGWVGQTLLAS